MAQAAGLPKNSRSSSREQSGGLHHPQVDSFAEDFVVEKHDLAEGGEDEQDHGTARHGMLKVLLSLHGESVESRRQREVHFGAVVVEEVLSFKEDMKALNAMFHEGIHHIQCNGCEERAPRRDMIKLGKTIWRCRNCELSDRVGQGPQPQGIDIQRGSCGGENIIIQHDEPLHMPVPVHRNLFAQSASAQEYHQTGVLT